MNDRSSFVWANCVLSLLLLLGSSASDIGFSMVAFGTKFEEAELRTVPDELFQGDPPHIIHQVVAHPTTMSLPVVEESDSLTTEPQTNSTESVIWSGTLPHRTFEIRLNAENGPGLRFNPGTGSLVVAATRFLAAEGLTQGEGCATLACLVEKTVECMIACALGVPTQPELCLSIEDAQPKKPCRGGGGGGGAPWEANRGNKNAASGDEEEGRTARQGEPARLKAEAREGVSAAAAAVRQSVAAAAASAAAARAEALRPAADFLFGFDLTKRSEADFHARLDLFRAPPPLHRTVLVVAYKLWSRDSEPLVAALREAQRTLAPRLALAFYNGNDDSDQGKRKHQEAEEEEEEAEEEEEREAGIEALGRSASRGDGSGDERWGRTSRRRMCVGCRKRSGSGTFFVGDSWGRSGLEEEGGVSVLQSADVVVFDGVFAYRDFWELAKLYRERPKHQLFLLVSIEAPHPSWDLFFDLRAVSQVTGRADVVLTPAPQFEKVREMLVMDQVERRRVREVLSQGSNGAQQKSQQQPPQQHHRQGLGKPAPSWLVPPCLLPPPSPSPPSSSSPPPRWEQGVVAYVSSRCLVHRDRWVFALRAILRARHGIDVDVLGKCLRKKREKGDASPEVGEHEEGEVEEEEEEDFPGHHRHALPSRDTTEVVGHSSEDFNFNETQRVLSRFKFVIAAENTMCDQYCSEKLWLPLARGQVPIVRGCFSAGKLFAPTKDSVLQVEEFESPLEVAHEIARLHANLTAFKRKVEWWARSGSASQEEDDAYHDHHLQPQKPHEEQHQQQHNPVRDPRQPPASSSSFSSAQPLPPDPAARGTPPHVPQVPVQDPPQLNLAHRRCVLEGRIPLGQRLAALLSHAVDATAQRGGGGGGGGGGECENAETFLARDCSDGDNSGDGDCGRRGNEAAASVTATLTAVTGAQLGKGVRLETTTTTTTTMAAAAAVGNPATPSTPPPPLHPLLRRKAGRAYPEGHSGPFPAEDDHTCRYIPGAKGLEGG